MNFSPESQLKFEHPSPAYEITVNGKILDTQVQSRLMNLTHTDNRGLEADTLELDFDDADGKIALPSRGALISLKIGYTDSGLIYKGTYTVDEIAHNGAPDVLSIRARSGDLASGLTTQRERSFHETTLGEIIKTIAEENDLKPKVGKSLADLPIQHFDQTNESSASFLTRLAEMHDATISIKDGHLLFMPTGIGRTASGQRIPVATIRREDGDRHQFVIADRNAYKAIRALYHDLQGAVKGEVIWGEEENAKEHGRIIEKQNTAEQKAAQQAEEKKLITSGKYLILNKTYASRSKAQQAATKEWLRIKKKGKYDGVRARYNDKNVNTSATVQYGRVEEQHHIRQSQKQAEKDNKKLAPESKPSEPINAFERTDDNVKTLRHVYANKTNATRAARAEWRKLQRGQASFSITLAHGNPELFPDTPVTVTGFKPQIDSTDWIIIRVVNSIGDSGYTQRLELELGFLGDGSH